MKLQKLQNTINDSLKIFEKEFINEKNNKLIIRQTQSLSILFIEILIVGLIFLLFPLIPNIPWFLLIFSTPYLNFGFTLFFLIPLNLILGQILIRNRLKKLEDSKLIETIEEYVTEDISIWKEVISREMEVLEKPSKEDIKQIILSKTNLPPPPDGK